VQQNVKGMIQAADQKDPDSTSSLLTFGLNAKRKCEDIEFHSMKTGKIDSQIAKYHPGNLSRTPLASAIEIATNAYLKESYQRVVIFSDGADTCHRDPCEQLKKSNELVRAAGKVMPITFIGIALAQDAPKFSCFKLPYSNLKIDYSEINSAQQAQQALQQIPESKIDAPKPPYASVIVKGAPYDAQFSAQGEHQRSVDIHWSGSYPHRILADRYVLKSGTAHTRAVTIDPKPGESKTLYWEDFFKSDKIHLNYHASSVSVLFTPTDATKEMHRKVAPIIVDGDDKKGTPLAKSTDKDHLQDVELPFGIWQVTVVSPPWLKMRAGTRTVNAEPTRNQDFDTYKVFSLHDEAVPDSKLRNVFQLDKGNRFFLDKGTPSIPMAEGQSPTWIMSAP